MRPGLAAYRDVLRDEVLPHARPDERVRPELAARTATTPTTRRCATSRPRSKTAQEIHDIGLAQVAKLADEYRALGPEVVGTDDLEKIFEAMRTDPALHFEHGEELVEASEVAMAAGRGRDARLVRGRPAGALRRAGHDDRRQGVLLPAGHRRQPRRHVLHQHRRPVLVGHASSSRRWPSTRASPATTSSSRSPRELPDAVPEFRKHIHNAAYAEGWGLYTERLSDEMGLYSAAVDRMGMYAADSMRACRLVVDTGLHALGWSRQQAIDYMVANSPLTEGVCRPGGRPLHRLARARRRPT